MPVDPRRRRRYRRAVRRLTSVFVAVLAACGPSESVRDAAMADAALDAAPDGQVDAGERPSPGEVFDGPARLSETGLYEDLAAGTLAADVLPYRVRFELWSDGAEKRRWLLLPPGARIDTRDPDRWVFPVGTRAWKEFRDGETRVETRFLHKVAEDRWENVAYVWRLDGSDADARPEGVRDALGTALDVPDTNGCFDCHRGVDGLIGVSAIQLATGEADELLARLEADDRLSAPIAPRPSVPGSPLEQAALGYLHANCSHCHGEGHPLSAARSLRMRIPLGLTDPLDAPALRTTAGELMHHTVDGTTIGVVPGDALQSQLYVRMQHRGDGWEMPQRGSERVDEAGSELIRRFLDGLPSPLP